MLRNKYHWSSFEKLVKMPVEPFGTYVINKIAFIEKGGYYIRINRKPLTNDGLLEIEKMAYEQDQSLIIIFIGVNHFNRAKNYLDFRNRRIQYED